MGLFDKNNISTTLAGIGSMVGSLGSSAMNFFASKSSREWQEKEAAKQRQWQGMPSQVARARMAGLNPNLVFGKGSGITNVPAMPAAPNMPEYSNPAEQLPDIAVRQRQTNIEQDVAESTIGKQDAEASFANEQAKKVMIQNQYEAQLLAESLKEAEAKAKKEGHEEEAAAYRARIEELNKNFAEETYDTRKERYDKELQQINETIENLKNERNVQKRIAAAQELQAKSAKIAADAQAYVAKATANNQNAQAEFNRAQAKIAKIEGTIRSKNQAVESFSRLMEMLQDFKAKNYLNQQLEAQTRLIEEQIRLAIKTGDWFEVGQLIESAKDIAITGASIGIAAKGGAFKRYKPVGFPTH